MKSRFLVSAVAVAALLAAPLAAADKPTPPPVVVQTLPVAKLLADAKAAVRLVLPPAEAADTIKKMDKGLEEKLGEKGLEGLDLTRPLGGYMFLPEKLDLTKLDKGPPDKEVLDEFYGVVVVPITGEKEFLDLLKRLDVDAEPVKGMKGLYALIPEGKDHDDEPAFRLRFANGHAYIGVNADDDDMDADELVPIGDLIVPGETAQFSYRAYYDRLPAGLKKSFTEMLKQLPGMVDAAPAPDESKEALKKLAGLYKRLAEQVIRDGDVATVRLKLDTTTGEIVYEGAISAKPGTQLAKDIAARKPTTNQFAGLIGDDTAGAVLIQLPLFAPEIKDAVAIGLAEGEKATAGMVPPMFKDVVAELWKGAGRTVKAGELDVAGVVNGPDKDGFFSVAAALTYADTSALEKKLRKLHADAPEEIQNQIKLDAAKIGEVSVHRMPVGLFLPPEAKKAFGDKASVAVAFAPNAIYLTFGPDSIAEMKDALAAKPGPAKAFDVVMNPARITKIIGMWKNDREGTEMLKLLGNDDKLMSVYGFAVEGGSELKLRFTMNVLPFARAAIGRTAAAPLP